MLECSRGLVRCRPQDYTAQASDYTHTMHQYIAFYIIYYTLYRPSVGLYTHHAPPIHNCTIYSTQLHNVHHEFHTVWCILNTIEYTLHTLLTLRPSYLAVLLLQILQPLCYHKYSSELKSAEKCHEGFGDFQSELFFPHLK